MNLNLREFLEKRQIKFTNEGILSKLIKLLGHLKLKIDVFSQRNEKMLFVIIRSGSLQNELIFVKNMKQT